MMTPRAIVRETFASLGRLVYPADCGRCGTPLDERAVRDGVFFCPDCVSALVHGGPMCRRCGAPVGPHLPVDDCARCRTERWRFDGTHVCGPYTMPALRQMCLRLKTTQAEPAPSQLARLWLSRHGQEERVLQCGVVIPVPHHRVDRFRRGVAAVNGLAEAIATGLDRPCSLTAVKKVRRTPKQASLSPTERRKNLRDCFSVASGVRFDGLRVLLVDDVFTTGTTVDRVTRALTDAGAAGVLVAAAARGVGDTV